MYPMLVDATVQCPDAQALGGREKLDLLGCAKQVWSLPQVTPAWHKRCQASSAACWAAGIADSMRISALAFGGSLELSWDPSLSSFTVNNELSEIADAPAQQKVTQQQEG